MGQTNTMRAKEKWMKDRQLKEAKASGIVVLTDEMKEMAGMNHKVVRDFSGGCSGLKKVKTEKK